MKAPIPAGLNSEQTKNAYTIYREFAKAYPDLAGGTALAMAAVVNAKAESNLKNVKTGIAGENSVGLFQLNENNPHGAALMGLWDRRYNAAANTRGIIKSLEDSGGPVFSAINDNANVPTISDRFRVYVERPANATQRGRETANLARSLFPSYSTTPAKSLPKLRDLEIPIDVTGLAIKGSVGVAILYFLGVI
jgi:hypothetical protein